MRLTTFLPLAFVALASAQTCNTKRGQVLAIKKLVQKYNRYNSEVEGNAKIDASVTEYARRAQRKKDKAGVKLAAKTATAQAAYDTAEAGIMAIFNTNSTIIDNAEAEVLSAIEDRATEKLANITLVRDAKLAAHGRRNVELSSRKQRIDSEVAAEIALINERKNNRVIRQQASHANKVANIAIMRNNRETEQVLRRNASVEAVNNALAVRIVQLQAEYAAKIAALEAIKHDTDATLASLDDAGTSAAGALPYPNDCILPVHEVIPEVKNGLSPQNVWRSLLGIEIKGGN